MCSIVYEPCDENSFKIGPAIQQLGKEQWQVGSRVHQVMKYERAHDTETLTDVGGSGDGGIGEAREQCNDKIVMPCDSEEFLAVSISRALWSDLILPTINEDVNWHSWNEFQAEGFSPSGLCDLLHCGNSFCNPGEPTCRIESE